MSIFDKLFAPPDVSALAAAGDVPGLVSALQFKKQATIRAAAAAALGDLGRFETWDELSRAAGEDDDGAVRGAASEAVSKLRERLGEATLFVPRRSESAILRVDREALRLPATGREAFLPERSASDKPREIPLSGVLGAKAIAKGSDDEGRQVRIWVAAEGELPFTSLELPKSLDSYVPYPCAEIGRAVGLEEAYRPGRRPAATGALFVRVVEAYWRQRATLGLPVSAPPAADLFVPGWREKDRYRTFLKSDGRTIALRADSIRLGGPENLVHVPMGKLVSTYSLEKLFYNELEELQIALVLEDGTRQDFSLMSRAGWTVEGVRTVQRYLEYASALFGKERFQEDTLADWTPLVNTNG